LLFAGTLSTCFKLKFLNRLDEINETDYLIPFFSKLTRLEQLRFEMPKYFVLNRAAKSHFSSVQNTYQKFFLNSQKRWGDSILSKVSNRSLPSKLKQFPSSQKDLSVQQPFCPFKLGLKLKINFADWLTSKNENSFSLCVKKLSKIIWNIDINLNLVGLN